MNRLVNTQSTAKAYITARLGWDRLVMPDEKESRAARLREARIAAGFENAAEAANRFGWPVVAYRSHENGIRGLKSAIVARYAKAYKVSFAWLANGEGPMRGPGIDAALMVLPPEVSKPLVEAILKLIEAAGPPKGKIPKP